ncbi:MAG: FAD binding domain-containing protein [bacterium]
MNNLEEYLYPESVEEAVELLGREDKNTRIIAGGTSIGLEKNESRSVDSLVDITKLELDYIEENKEGLAIGATTPVGTIEEDSAANELAGGIIASAAGKVGTTPLRNMITLGGNISRLRVWSDMPGVLLAADASVKVTGEDGDDEFSAEEFFSSHPGRLLDRTDVVTEVVFPPRMKEFTGDYLKFSKTDDSYATVSIAAALKTAGDKIEEARIAVTSASPLPVYCEEASTALAGEVYSEELAGKVAKICRENISTTDNLWGSASYKSILIERLVPRVLNGCLE